MDRQCVPRRIEPLMRACGALLHNQPKSELLWASVREVLNIFQADRCGCKIVTVPHDILAKAMKMVGTELATVSLDTVKTFLKDKEVESIKLDPKRETADIDESNNNWKTMPAPSKFTVFKQKLGAPRGGQNQLQGPNPMQKAQEKKAF